MSNSKSIKWIKTERNQNQYFIVAQVRIGNDEVEIRFEIDTKTADGFKKAFNQMPFKEKYGNDYSYCYAGYSVDKSNETHEHYVEISLARKRQKTKVPCSKIFCQNLKWLTEIEKIDDVKSITNNK